ncbi:hypothetical protein Bca4012_048964 [Brassica carinata]|uniref:B box-type domain-containing protein n=2 Tax=Brassica TaxID=3705 RepID=A0A0D3AM63_BRAOL|nr:PREDICTED: B-box zinc finger protein 23-like [Brassica oleracea var. oleracea]KAG2280560.1 hypothetical protein Bca52824_051780 [Brassica carinata]
MEKMKCELCEGVARMFCESDQASLCWDCDGNVHGANFLVAKHARCLLCSACQSPTPWKASGLRLCPTVSICESCLARKNNSGAGSNSYGEDDGAESNDEDEEDEESDDEEEEEAENQVVPCDAAAAVQESPVMSSSSSVSSGEERFSLVAKRTRQASEHNSDDVESNESGPLKRLKRDATSPRSTAMMKSTLKIKRL